MIVKVKKCGNIFCGYANWIEELFFTNKKCCIYAVCGMLLVMSQKKFNIRKGILDRIV